MKFIKKIANTSRKKNIFDNSFKLEFGSKILNSYLQKPIVMGENSFSSKSVLGKYFICGKYCEITQTEIGSFCSFGNNVCTNAGNHPSNWLSTHLFMLNSEAWNWYKKYNYKNKKRLKFKWKKKVKIGNDVWIGNNVVILTGIKIGNGAIIGANSIVTKDVKDYSVVAGSPARHIRYRFNKKQINKLNKLKWWKETETEINKLTFDNVKNVLKDIN